MSVKLKVLLVFVVSLVIFILAGYSGVFAVLKDNKDIIDVSIGLGATLIAICYWVFSDKAEKPEAKQAPLTVTLKAGRDIIGGDKNVTHNHDKND